MGVERSQHAGRTTTKYRLESSGDAIGRSAPPRAMVGGCSLPLAPESRATAYSWRNLIHPRCLAGLPHLPYLPHLIDWAVDENAHPDSAYQKVHCQKAAQRHGRGSTMVHVGFGACHPYPPVTLRRT